VYSIGTGFLRIGWTAIDRHRCAVPKATHPRLLAAGSRVRVGACAALVSRLNGVRLPDAGWSALSSGGLSDLIHEMPAGCVLEHIQPDGEGLRWGAKLSANVGSIFLNLNLLERYTGSRKFGTQDRTLSRRRACVRTVHDDE